MNKIKVLIITYYPWREDNNVGNSYSNLFAGMDDKIEFSQIYVRDGMPQNKLAHDYFHISDINLLKGFLGCGGKTGEYIHLDNPMKTSRDNFSKAFNKARALRWDILLLIRELAGFNPKWKSEELDNFLDKIQPDIVFGTLPNEKILSNLMLYVKKRNNIPLITYPWDDYYSLKHSSYSPIFWIRKFIQRHYLCKTAKESSFLYVISAIMQKEYTAIFRKKCKMLYKGHKFENIPKQKKTGNPIKIIYMGNIGGGRWKALASLASSIKDINEKSVSARLILDVYTLSAKTEEIDKALNIEGASAIFPPVANEEVQSTMDSADILLHVEPWEGKERSFYRASFSTKLVDYFYAAKCILSIGGSTASTDYLKDNEAAIVINEKSEVEPTLLKIIEKPVIIKEYALKAWNCGFRNHQIEKIQNMLYTDFKNTRSKWL